jgi:hypothetical protein
MTEPTGALGHSAWAAARLLMQTTRTLPEPLGASLKPSGVEVQVGEPQDVAAWGKAYGALVRFDSFASHVSVSATFTEGTVVMRVWDHMNHNEAAEFLKTQGMDLTIPRDVDPQTLIDWTPVEWS